MSKRAHAERMPKGPPPVCPRCKTDENVVPATNYGVPTGGWWCRGHGGHVATPEAPKGP